MTTPSAGDATLYGKSIVEDMASIRQDVGFCPQVASASSASRPR
jgi:ABC-type multidrug transport system ATPase subunit